MQNVIVNTLTLICPIFVKLFYVLKFYRDCTIMLTKVTWSMIIGGWT